MDLDRILELVDELERGGVAYVVVGGVALNLHGIVRATEDGGIFVSPAPENVERLKQALQRVWDDPEIERISAEDLGGDYPTVRYGPPDEELAVDILSRLGEAFRFEDIEWQTVEIGGHRVRVATPRMLLRMKRATIRPIDRADAAALAEAFDLREETDAGYQVHEP